MKLLNCTACNDIVAIHGSVRSCVCGESKAVYLADRLTVHYSGQNARILGIRNQEYMYSQINLNPETDYNWFVITGKSIVKVENL